MSLTPFAYVNAEKSILYRAVMMAFVEAKRRFLVHLRPEDIAGRLSLGKTASLEEIQAALDQLVQWGNLQANPDTGRVTSVEDFYRARYLYQLTREGEAAEIALAAYDEALGRRGALQAVALEDIRMRLRALETLALQPAPDPARVHALLRDLSRVFTDLAENAQFFMTGLGRTLDLRNANREAFIAYKERLIGYLERFIGDLVTASADIARQLQFLSELLVPEAMAGQAGGSTAGEALNRLFTLAARREAADMVPSPELEDDDLTQTDRIQHCRVGWQTRWQGLQSWFVGTRERPSQASLLRNRARKAITDLLEAVARLNEWRLGRSDRSADFRTLARWFAETESDLEAHRLWRAAFGLTPARHLALDQNTLEQRQENPVAASTSWMQAPPLQVSPHLRATGSFHKRGLPPKVQRRDQERAVLARQLCAESAQTRAARMRLATGRKTRLSEIGELDRDSFALFLQLLGEALSIVTKRDIPVSIITGDGSLHIELKPLAADSHAEIHTPDGIFRGRDYRLCITDLEKAGGHTHNAETGVEI